MTRMNDEQLDLFIRDAVARYMSVESENLPTPVTATNDAPTNTTEEHITKQLSEHLNALNYFMYTPTHEMIADRIKRDGGSFVANSNISKWIKEDELEQLQMEVQEVCQQLLKTLVIDTENDHNTQETAKRLSKMFLYEVFRGRYQPRPDITDFPNVGNLDEVYTLGPITVRSACSHHMVPITGQCWVGVMPSDRVIGISKFNRLVDWIMRRPHIQEEAVVMIANEIEQLIKPRGVGVVVRATHQCMTWRGVEESDTSMVTSVMRGVFREDPEIKKEFFNIIKGQGYL